MEFPPVVDDAPAPESPPRKHPPLLLPALIGVLLLICGGICAGAGLTAGQREPEPTHRPVATLPRTARPTRTPTDRKSVV